jgi:hypothetical protein
MIFLLHAFVPNLLPFGVCVVACHEKIINFLLLKKDLNFIGW